MSSNLLNVRTALLAAVMATSSTCVFAGPTMPLPQIPKTPGTGLVAFAGPTMPLPQIPKTPGTGAA